MRFQVPQFIEVEDKIFGPLTFKQFIYLAGGGGICVTLFFYLPNFIALIVAAPFAGLALALAFYKVNNKPFLNLVESAFKYAFGNKLYTWKREDKKVVGTNLEGSSPELFVPKLSQSKLKDLTWSLDVKKDLESPATPRTSQK